MALATTLMAVGIPAEQANRLGYEDRVPLDGNGTTQAGATEIIATNTNVAAGTSAGDTAFILPADAEYFQPYFVLNSTPEPALIFPPVGDTIDANAVDAAVEIEEDLARVFQRVEEGRWVSFPAGEGGGGIDSIVAGTGIAVDNTDPDNPVVSNTGVLSVTAGSNITIGGTAQNPVVNGNAGTVTSVGLSAPADLSVTGSPVIGAGTLALDWTTPPTGTGAMVRATSPALAGTPTAPTAAVDTNTTQIATTAMVLGQAAAAIPLGNAATAVVGISTRYARADHVHPGREVLTADRTYYVRTDGSDSNNGLTNSAGGAFLTLQKGIDTVYGLDLNGFNVTVQIGGGTYTAGVFAAGAFVGKGTVTLQGNLTTPANCVVSVTSANCIDVREGCFLRVAGIKLQTTTSGTGLAATSGAIIRIVGLMDFGACATYHINGAQGGRVIGFGANYNITGGAAAHWLTDSTGSQVSIQLATITLTGTPAFSVFASAASLSHIVVNANTFSGSATGTRYSASLNAVIATGGGGATYLPGSIGGSTATGGQYA